MPPVVIVGLGVSGLGCALELTRRNVPFLAFEKENRPGGLAKTESLDGFRFDYGPHILLALPTGIEELLRELPGLDLARCSGRSGIVLETRMDRVAPAPFQQNLASLPLPVRARLLFDLLAHRRQRPAPLATYEDYAVARCGKRVYDIFLRGYDSKRLRFPLNELPADWTNRVDKTSLRSLLVPRASGNRESRFLYPRSGSIEALPRAMARILPGGATRYGEELVEIHPQSKSLTFASGAREQYEHLVPSLPLPEIVRLARDLPAGAASPSHLCPSRSNPIANPIARARASTRDGTRTLRRVIFWIHSRARQRTCRKMVPAARRRTSK